MEYKKEIEKLLEVLKQQGITRADIEDELGYSSRYIDQTLSKGGNRMFHRRLQEYYNKVLQKAIQGHRPVDLALLIEQQNKLIVSLNKQSETANAILERMANSIEKKVESIDSNLTDALARVDSLKYDLHSGRVVVLQSLARIEKRPVNSLLSEADSIVASLISQHDEKPSKIYGRGKKNI